jgi:mono/diheme cytochrome c family protein
MHVTRRTCYDYRMRFFVVVAIVCSLWTAGLLQAARQEPASSTWSGVYTEAQAKLGQEAYVKTCSECHGQDLAGDGYAPGLKGPDFMTNWNGLTVGELFDRIRVSMPPSNPNSVSAKEKADIVAYLLQEAGFPAGNTELPATIDALKAIKFEATKPGK